MIRALAQWELLAPDELGRLEPFRRRPTLNSRGQVVGEMRGIGSYLEIGTV